MPNTPISPRADDPPEFDPAPQDRRDNEPYVRAVHDRGLSFDLATLSRRRMLALAGGLGLASTVGVLVWPDRAVAAASCLEEIESETGGPYPADGTNGPDVRVESGIVRKDIRTSFGNASGTAEGIPTTIALTIQDLDCAPLAGVAVYLWHCNRDGDYSLYSSAITDENYLRGIQESDDSGVVRFTSIFPACYSGRWPHIHFEVYSSVADATSGSGTVRKTSQLALPEAVCTKVFATDGYSASVANLGQITLATDNVFGDDDAARELATVTGSVTDGFLISLTVTVDPTASEGSSGAPSGVPTSQPSGTPTGAPPGQPSGTPTTTASASPTTASPTSASPTGGMPSSSPTSTSKPTKSPTPQPGHHRHHPRPPWWHGWWPFGG